MSEFTGAVLGAQLTKLERMVRDQKKNADMVYDGIRDLPGIRLRKQPDPAGDIGYGVFFDAGNKEKQSLCIKRLRDMKLPAATLTGSVLLPIQESVVNKHTRHPNWPSFNTHEGKAIQYGPDCCRQTLDVYDRFVQVRIGPKYTEEENKRIIESVREVWNAELNMKCNHTGGRTIHALMVRGIALRVCGRFILFYNSKA